MRIEVVHRESSRITGLEVRGKFTDLGRLVPEAWRRLASSGAPQGRTYAELSRAVADGYVEVIGLLDGELNLRGPRTVTVEVPAGEWVRHVHVGPVDAVASTFGRIQDWARSQGREPSGELLDVGYRLDGEDDVHELWVRLAEGT